MLPSIFEIRFDQNDEDFIGEEAFYKVFKSRFGTSKKVAVKTASMKQNISCVIISDIRTASFLERCPHIVKLMHVEKNDDDETSNQAVQYCSSNVALEIGQFHSEEYFKILSMRIYSTRR